MLTEKMAHAIQETTRTRAITPARARLTTYNQEPETPPLIPPITGG